MRGKVVSANEYSCAHGAQINYGDLTPYLAFAGTFTLLYVSHRYLLNLERAVCLFQTNQVILGLA
jgi:hypothetical protein